MTRTMVAAVALLVPLPAAAEPVAVSIEWNGSDQTAGVLVNRVRGLVAGTPGKRLVNSRAPGLHVIVQSIDPAREWRDDKAAQRAITVYSVTITIRRMAGPDEFGSTVLGYCEQADVVNCASEIIATIDEEIARRGLASPSR